MAEDGRIAVRHARTEGRDKLKKLDKVAEDDVKAGERELQKAHDDFVGRIDRTLKDERGRHPRSVNELVKGTAPSADELARIRAHGGVPRHVAIIMDGNGRWARARSCPVRSATVGNESGPGRHGRGDRRGARWSCRSSRFRKRMAPPRDGDRRAHALLEEYIAREIDDLRTEGVRVHVLRQLPSGLPRRPRRAVSRMIIPENSRTTTSWRSTCSSPYGGRAELVRAAQQLAQMSKRGGSPSTTSTRRSSGGGSSRRMPRSGPVDPDVGEAAALSSPPLATGLHGAFDFLRCSGRTSDGASC